MTDETRLRFSETERLSALENIKIGYRLPPRPSPSLTWNSDYLSFTNEFACIMRQRYSDYRIAGAPDNEVQRKQDAVIAVHTARTARDIDAIDCFHRLLLKTENPGDIKRCVKAIRLLHPKARIVNIISSKHVTACKAIREAVDDWEYNWKPLRLVERVMEEMILLGMTNVNRADEIATLIRQDITHSDRITAILKDFESTNVLLEGAL